MASILCRPQSVKGTPSLGSSYLHEIRPILVYSLRLVHYANIRIIDVIMSHILGATSIMDVN